MDNKNSDENQQDNVVLLDPNEMRDAKPKKKPDEEAKMRKVEVFKLVSFMMVGTKSKQLPPFHKKFHVRTDRTGEHEYLEEIEGQVLRPTSTTFILDTIFDYCRQLRHRNYDLKRSEIKEIFYMWASFCPRLDEVISPVLQKSTPGYCWHRLDFNISEGNTPIFDELMGRATNSYAIKAWIGSLFDPKADRQQYVWLYGDGSNGKGTLTRFLQRVMGNDTAVANEQLPQRGKEPNQFWTSGLLGKRLVIFGDNDNTDFPVSGFFKSLTGGDGTRIEKKGQQPFSVMLDCKFIFNSNKRPEIVNTPADKRRAIFSTFGPRGEYFGKNYEERLWQEAKGFLFECLKVYREATADINHIPIEQSATNDLIEENESKYKDFIDRYLHVDESLTWDKCCTSVNMTEYFKQAGIRSNNEIKKYKDYMATQGIKYCRNRSGSDKTATRYFSNCRTKFYVSDQSRCINCGKHPGFEEG